MFKSFLNNLYIKIWSGQKKVGPHKNVLLKRSCESFGDTVYDLRWSLKYIHKNGETSHTVTLTERASKWNLKRVIHHIEKHKLPKEIDALIRRNTHTD